MTEDNTEDHAQSAKKETEDLVYIALEWFNTQAATHPPELRGESLSHSGHSRLMRLV